MSNAVKLHRRAACVSVNVASTADALRIVVRDTGIGFQPDTAHHLFEQFRQGDTATRQYGWLGLGLAIARHLVEQHGGTISAHSDDAIRAPNSRYGLPARADGATVPNRTPPVEPAPLLRGLSVLVVDDNPEDREFVRTSLEQYGAVVRTAASTQEACERFRRDHPDVVVSDLVMPDQDGLELIRRIRAMDEPTGRFTPAAALSGLARADDRRRALSAGYQMHVQKSRLIRWSSRRQSSGSRRRRWRRRTMSSEVWLAADRWDDDLDSQEMVRLLALDAARLLSFRRDSGERTRRAGYLRSTAVDLHQSST